ncbi:MAG: hypothetical protein JHC74_15515, partial [Thermoleophilia bacterium]|nr:hypothetical protein [Thermoleophilia bacterium]
SASGEGQWVVGVDFDDLDRSVTDAIVSWCFRFPFGPDCAVMPPPSTRAPEPEPEDVLVHEDSTLLAAAEAAATEAGDDDPEDAPEGSA